MSKQDNNLSKHTTFDQFVRMTKWRRVVLVAMLVPVLNSLWIVYRLGISTPAGFDLPKLFMIGMGIAFIVLLGWIEYVATVSERLNAQHKRETQVKQISKINK